MTDRTKIVLVIFCVMIALSALYRNRDVSSVAIDNTMRNSFVVGCKQEADQTPALVAEYNIDYYCGCAFDALKNKYGEQFNNEYINKVIAEGYSQEDIALIAPCLVRR